MRRSAAVVGNKAARSKTNVHRPVVHLLSLPHHAVPRDIRKMAETAGVKGTYESIIYASAPLRRLQLLIYFHGP